MPILQQCKQFLLVTRHINKTKKLIVFRLNIDRLTLTCSSTQCWCPHCFPLELLCCGYKREKKRHWSIIKRLLNYEWHIQRVPVCHTVCVLHARVCLRASAGCCIDQLWAASLWEPKRLIVGEQTHMTAPVNYQRLNSWHWCIHTLQERAVTTLNHLLSNCWLCAGFVCIHNYHNDIWLLIYIYSILVQLCVCLVPQFLRSVLAEAS